MKQIDEIYSVRKVKKFMGMDCPGYNAELLKNGKAYGTVSDYGNGGPVEINIPRDDYKEFNTYSKEMGKSFGAADYYDCECFVGTLVLLSTEKASAKRSKKSTIVMLVAPSQWGDGNEIVYDRWNAPYNQATKDHLAKQYKGEYTVLSSEIN